MQLEHIVRYIYADWIKQSGTVHQVQINHFMKFSVLFYSNHNFTFFCKNNNKTVNVRIALSHISFKIGKLFV